MSPKRPASKISTVVFGIALACITVPAWAQGASGGASAAPGGSSAIGAAPGASTGPAPMVNSAPTVSSQPSATPNQSTNYFDPGAPATSAAVPYNREGTTTYGTAGSVTPQPGSTTGSASSTIGQSNGGTTGTETSGRVGVGTAPNGVPIGNSGSGLGSPEHPYNSSAR